jgi:hypothetical protein
MIHLRSWRSFPFPKRCVIRIPHQMRTLGRNGKAQTKTIHLHVYTLPGTKRSRFASLAN